jgi:hypothetical protein
MKTETPLLTTLDRLFWITLRSLWFDWRHPLIYVQADTRRPLASRTVSEILGATVQVAAPGS